MKARSFATRNMSYAKSDISHKNTSGVPTGSHRVSQYWIPKSFISNPSTEASTSSGSM